MGFGDNTIASLITRGLAETARLGVALGADPLTFAGLAGLGDLVATCSSPLSRNRTFGERLGRGRALEQAQQATHGQVAEGVEVVPVGARAGRAPWGRRADHPGGRGRLLPRAGAGRHGARAHVPVDEVRGQLTASASSPYAGLA